MMKIELPARRIAAALLVILFLVPSLACAEVRAIQGFALTVADCDRATVFYEAVLGFKKISEQVISGREFDRLTGISGTRVKSVKLRLGADSIELDQFVSATGQPIPRDSRSNDLWFQHMAIVVSDMDQAYRHLQNFHVQAISDAPQTIPESNPAASGIKAFKFKDPDGHPMELLYFPPGKGRAKWHKANGKLFLGIDHSAITVSDTGRSLSFYRDILGLVVTGGSLNNGATQEHLDNAIGAVVQVTALHPDRPGGPGLEFLQYITPGGGRPIPLTMRANDIAHLRTVLEVDDIAMIAAQLQRSNAFFISPGVVSVNGLGYSKGLMVKDPDGHVLLLVQP